MENNQFNAVYISTENQYQTVNNNKSKKQNVTNSFDAEDILKKISPRKSFLYRNHVKRKVKIAPPYVPMDTGSTKKHGFFKLSSYDYPLFDFRSKISKSDSFNDRGYYIISANDNQTNSVKSNIGTTLHCNPLNTWTWSQRNEQLPEHHLYEDLCYDDKKETPTAMSGNGSRTSPEAKPCLTKIQQMFQSFKFPFFKKNDEVKETHIRKPVVGEDQDGHMYENNDNTGNMYDTVQVPGSDANIKGKESELVVEEYLEPIQPDKDYCDVNIERDRDESLLAYIVSIFENRFGLRSETNEAHRSDRVESEIGQDEIESDIKWSDGRKQRKNNMAARPLPVPVENEPYFMRIDRYEAENLLRGQLDGTFILRPSSQTNHAYTLSVSCGGAVHNVGVRRRPDGRLALGFPRRNEPSFPSITALLQHHRRRRLLLLAGGGLLGATTLADSPQYYQAPTSIPLPPPL